METSGAFTFKLISEPADYQSAKRLFIEYAASLEIDLCFQGFDHELEDLEVQYGKPVGGLLLIIDNSTGEAIGCAGVRKSEEGIAELKRMYIKEQYRSKGLGRAILHAAISLSKDLGYRKMRLDTLDTMKAAMAVYLGCGFYEIGAYRFNPNDNVRYFEKDIEHG